MSVHPNVILKCTVKAEGTTRKLLRELLAANREQIPDSSLPLMLNKDGNPIENAITGEYLRISRDKDQLCIGDFSYSTLVMENDYDEDIQIAGQEGDLVIFDLVTYGYGEEIKWKILQSRVDSLEVWAIQNGLSYTISISANYW
jgi:hypothetical protein